jgi:hypothetical protein
VLISSLDLTIEYPERRRGFTQSIQENSRIIPQLGYEILKLSDSLFMNYLNHPGRAPCKTPPERACCIFYNIGSFHIRVRAGIAGYHFVFESFWHVKMIS